MKLKLTTLALATMFSTSLVASEIDFSKLTQSQKDQLGEVVTQYLEENPKFLIKASENLERIMAKEEAEKAQKSISDFRQDLLSDKSPNYGKKDARFTLVIFSDYNCPYCQRFSTTVESFMEDNKDDIRIIYKDFAYQTEASRHAAVLGLMIFDQKGSEVYHNFHKEVYAQMRDKALKTRQDVEKVAKKFIDSDFKDISKYVEQAQESYELGQTVGVSGTPSSILLDSQKEENVFFFRGNVPREALEAKVKEFK